MTLESDPSASKPSKLYSTKSEDRLWDYVVIGSGMGGLTTAATLAKAGKQVLILEQHYVPGGFTHTFRRKRWTWDVGVHAVGEVTDRSILGRVLEGLTDGRLKWSSLGETYDEFYFPDLRIDFPGDRKAFHAALVSAFPNEEPAIDQYFKLIREVAGTMPRYYLSRVLPTQLAMLGSQVIARDATRLLKQRTQDVLDGLTSNTRLKTVMTAQWGYYGVPPSRSSFAIHALVAKHFWHGGYYPEGGSGQIAEALMTTVRNAGGAIRIRASVAEIRIQDGRANGVVLDGGEIIRAKRVVSAAGALTTVNKLLPAEYRQQPWARQIAALQASPCHLCLYLGFKGDIRKAGATAANKWFYETWAGDAIQWEVEDETADAPVLYCSFPSLKDPRHDPGPDVLHTGEVVTFAPYDVFAAWKDGRWRKRGADYESLKKDLETRMLKQFLRHMPALEPYLAYVELSTPISTEHFTRATRGAIYGLEPTPERYATDALRPRTKIPGLFLSGSDVVSVGVMGAMGGGLLAAIAAEPAKTLPWIRRFAMRR